MPKYEPAANGIKFIALYDTITLPKPFFIPPANPWTFWSIKVVKFKTWAFPSSAPQKVAPSAKKCLAHAKIPVGLVSDPWSPFKNLEAY